MAYGLEGGGVVGIGMEITPGTYVAPTKFFPVLSETLKYMQATVWRKPIRQNIDVIGAVNGDSQVTGDITMEAFEDVCPYFHACSRATWTRSGSVSPGFIYPFIPSSVATPARTMSITVLRNGIVYGYVGCAVGDFTYSIANGILEAKFAIVGYDEAVQSSPTVTWPTTAPFGAGQYNIQIPTASQVFDADTFNFTVNDNLSPQFRLRNTSRAPYFTKYGERSVKLSLTRDFQSRSEYDAFKALTAQALTIIATKGANNQVTVTMPVAIKDVYEVNLSGQANLVRAKVDYIGTFDPSTSKSYEIDWATQEQFT